jgi:hypothetical protein
MTRTLALIPAAVAAIALAMTPAMAKSKKHHNRSQFGYYEQHFGTGSSKYLYDDSQFRNGWGMTSRNVSDPSYNSNIRFRQNPYRCTEDLGYGRYEYCGW